MKHPHASHSPTSGQAPDFLEYDQATGWRVTHA